MIPLFKSTSTGNELAFLKAEAEKTESGFYSPIFTEKCIEYFSSQFPGCKLFLTSSCSRALELCIKLANLKPGDEVILPSFTYVASANAIVQYGGVPVFVDILPGHPNINPALIEAAITNRTVAIMPVHYAGVGCEMDEILLIAQKHNLLVIEDAAHGVGAFYKNKALGGIGDFGCISFDKMKNLSCGEGGLLIVTNPAYFERAEVLFDNGTNRAAFLKGEVPFFQWIDEGSNYKLSPVCAGVLLAQLNEIDHILKPRINNWHFYYENLLPLQQKGKFELPEIKEYCSHNAHIFYIKTESRAISTKLIAYLKQLGIEISFHFTPLHSSHYGKEHSRFIGEDVYTSADSGRLLRLPIYHKITIGEMELVVNGLKSFFINN